MLVKTWNSESTFVQKIQQKKIRCSHVYLPLLLAFIFLDETCDNYIFNVFSKEKSLLEFIFYSVFLLITIVASPIQAGYSDFFCRKKSLVFSLSFSLLSALLAFLSLQNIFSPLFFLFLAALVKAGFGNNLPLSWAAISDVQSKNFRFSLGLSTSAMAFGYFVLILIKKFFNANQSAIILLLAFAILIYFCIRKFEDIRDKDKGLLAEGALEKDLLPASQHSQIKKMSLKGALTGEVKLIFNDFLKDNRTRKALCTFMLWEVSFYTALIVDVDMRVKWFENLSLSMLVGYLLGVLILRFLKKKKDEEMIKIGYVISILSLFPIFAIGPFVNMKLTIIICYFFYSLAAAFLAPSLFSILSKERKAHEQGKIYGLIDATDTVAFLFASISVMIYSLLQINPAFLAGFSFFVFLISLFYYEKFKKTSPRII